MGLLTEFLYPTPKSKARQPMQETQVDKEDDTAPKGVSGETTTDQMASMSQHMTLDGEVPNGGVPPDRLAVEMPKPPAPSPPPEDPPYGGMAFQNWMVLSHNPIVVPFYAQRIDNHFHLHATHNADQSTPAVSKSHIRFIGNGVNPSHCWPALYQGYVGGSDIIAEETLSIRALHMQIGSDRDGRGFQVVHKQGDRLWLPGPVFEWGKGDAAQPIRETILGKGKPGEEVHVCQWTRT